MLVLLKTYLLVNLLREEFFYGYARSTENCKRAYAGVLQGLFCL